MLLLSEKFNNSPRAGATLKSDRDGRKLASTKRQRLRTSPVSRVVGKEKTNEIRRIVQKIPSRNL